MFVAKPKLLFLDAMGTLFGLKQSVGQTYASLAARHNIEVHPEALDRQFRLVFREYHAPTFLPDLSEQERLAQEKKWWHQVVLKTFEGHLLSELEPLAFELFFNEVFDYFCTSAAWMLYPEVPRTLSRWEQEGIEMGVISNFDSRLFQVLEALEIRHFFQSVTLSSQVDRAKPDARIYHHALEIHGCKAQNALHIGDQWADDYEGATRAGLTGVWLNRQGQTDEAIQALDQIHWRA